MYHKLDDSFHDGLLYMLFTKSNTTNNKVLLIDFLEDCVQPTKNIISNSPFKIIFKHYPEYFRIAYDSCHVAFKYKDYDKYFIKHQIVQLCKLCGLKHMSDLLFECDKLEIYMFVVHQLIKMLGYTDRKVYHLIQYELTKMPDYNNYLLSHLDIYDSILPIMLSVSSKVKIR